MEEKKKKRESTFGIDFGTSNTVVTYFMRDRIVCYQNQDNLPFVQSIVALSSTNELLIGRAADKVTKPLFRQMLAEEMLVIQDELGEHRYSSGRFDDAARLMEQITTSDELIDFLTLPGYRLLA